MSRQTIIPTNHQQSKSTQHNKQNLKILQININGIHKKTHRTGTHPEKQRHRHSNCTGDKTGQPSQNPHNTTIHHTQNQQITQKRRRTHYFHKTNINFNPLTTPNNINTSKTELQTIKIHLTQTKHLHVANIYIPPRDTTEPNHGTEDTDITNTFTHLTNIDNPLNHRRHQCSLTPMALTHRRPPWDTVSRYNSELQPNHAEHKHTNPHTTTPKPTTHLTRHHNHNKHTTKKH